MGLLLTIDRGKRRVVSFDTRLKNHDTSNFPIRVRTLHIRKHPARRVTLVSSILKTRATCLSKTMSLLFKVGFLQIRKFLLHIVKLGVTFRFSRWAPYDL